MAFGGNGRETDNVGKVDRNFVKSFGFDRNSGFETFSDGSGGEVVIVEAVAALLYLGNILCSNLSVFVFSASTSFVLSVTTSSKFAVYFSNSCRMRSNLFSKLPTSFYPFKQNLQIKLLPVQLRGQYRQLALHVLHIRPIARLLLPAAFRQQNKRALYLFVQSFGSVNYDGIPEKSGSESEGFACFYAVDDVLGWGMNVRTTTEISPTFGVNPESWNASVSVNNSNTTNPNE